MRNEPDLKKRTKAFALRILKLVDALPKTTAGRALASQIVRSGTSVAANYRAACRARSTADFTAKMGIVEEEGDETLFWLELLEESNSLSSEADSGQTRSQRIDPHHRRLHQNSATQSR